MLSWIGLGKPTTVSVSLQDMDKIKLSAHNTVTVWNISLKLLF